MSYNSYNSSIQTNLYLYKAEALQVGCARQIDERAVSLTHKCCSANPAYSGSSFKLQMKKTIEHSCILLEMNGKKTHRLANFLDASTD